MNGDEVAMLQAWADEIARKHEAQDEAFGPLTVSVDDVDSATRLVGSLLLLGALFVASWAIVALVVYLICRIA